MEDSSDLFQLTRPSLLAFAGSILKNDEDAQDVVQEVFSECLGDRKANVNRPYLFKAVRNRSLNKLRTHRRFSIAIERFADYLQLFEDDYAEKPAIEDLLNKLPPKQSEVLVLRIKAELKIKEIAEILDIPEGTVKSRINKGLKNLKNNFEG